MTTGMANDVRRNAINCRNVDLKTPSRSRPRGGNRPEAAAVGSAEWSGDRCERAGMSAAQRWAAVSEYAVRLAGRVDELAELRHRVGCRELSCRCSGDDLGCHRRVLLDYAEGPTHPVTPEGRAIGLTVRRPWASLLLVPEQAGGKSVENRTDCTDYRGPVLIYGGTRIDNAGLQIGERLGLSQMDFHAEQQGWLGATVLVDVHRARGCCAPWGKTPYNPGQPMYHWVFESPARLAVRPWHKNSRGFVGLQPVSWAALLSRQAARALSERVRP